MRRSLINTLRQQPLRRSVRSLRSSAATANKFPGGVGDAGQQWAGHGESTWDSDTQTFHAGQDWMQLTAEGNFIEDFSVTTNAFGTPKKAEEAAAKACSLMHHYPPADFEPAISDLAKFLWPTDTAKGKERLLMGNGASELIDLVIRDGPIGRWKPAGVHGLMGGSVQYKEYERSAQAAGHEQVDAGAGGAELTCCVNPNNPTGGYRPLREMQKYLEENCADGSHAIVDESMQPWVGPNWREESLTSDLEWLERMEQTRGISVFVMHSWTKIWACPGVRLGSVVAPSAAALRRVKAKQVPWSVNLMALDFTSAVVQDNEYLEKTWKYTTQWRKQAVDMVNERHPTWEVHGAPFNSWIWLDCKSADVAAAVVEASKAAGMPIRSGAPGYNMHSYVRFAVRDPELTARLLDTWTNVPEVVAAREADGAELKAASG